MADSRDTKLLRQTVRLLNVIAIKLGCEPATMKPKSAASVVTTHTNRLQGVVTESDGAGIPSQLTHDHIKVGPMRRSRTVSRIKDHE